MNPQIAAVVLAAGFSSRMHGFKPLLPLGTATVIERVAYTLNKAGISEIVVVLGYQAELLVPVLQRLKVRYVVNESYREGMSGSVQTGIRALPSDAEAFFLWPVDIPLVKSRSVRLLVRDYIQYQSDVTYPNFQGERGHPPLLSARIKPMVLSQKSPDGLRRLLEEQVSLFRDVDLMDEGVLIDMDTQEDYEKILERDQNYGVPSPAECRQILAYVGASSEVVRHGQAVSGIARILASQLNQSGMKLNVKMAETAGLLHDLAKGKKHHARTGGRILKSLGFGPVAWIVSQHMDFEFSAADPINEAAIVYLADKLTREDHYVSVETRFASATMKYPPGHALEPMIMHRMSVAQKIAAAVEQQCGQALSTLISMNNEALEEHTSNVAKF